MRVARASAGRTGAVAAIAPAALLAAWTWAAVWYQSVVGLVLIVSILATIAILAGGLVGARIGPSMTSSALGVGAYAAVAWLLFVPIGVAWAIWEGFGDGSIRDAAGLAVTVAGRLAYGLVSTLYMVFLLLPLGVSWIVAFRVLGRRSAR